MQKKQRVLITGASGGLGQTVVGAFLRAGAQVIANGRETANLQALSSLFGDSKDQLTTIAADVTDENAVEELFAQIQNEFLGIDSLIHLAGGFRAGAAVADTSLDDWRFMIQLNLESAFLCSRAAMAQMAVQGHGKIVLTSALAALQAKPKRAAYTVAKAGIIALTQTLAQEGKDHGIQVNCLAPGIVVTDANRKAMPDAHHSKWASPQRIAQTLLFLCSADADDISGTIVQLPGRM
ncbi:MAG TPA: SDR family NAD(P)-dependent oxidoreductase [bacterium]|nr:SDR family NAD(P)-dependent oxidoreductase [bacterium]HOX86169.1 SDR family NAD(P)-dependent oxidoreductase [bacterium]HPG45617.1 SDR family NAD(P)-dependent oxidoreductase [bacterium]HPM97604.1 SDR family NAD(P)-dependent oxidoreductase [bacterium]